MIQNCKSQTITAIQLGPLDSSTVEQTLYRANELQAAFDFQSAFYTHRLPLDEKYKLPNGGYDLFGAVEYMLRITLQGYLFMMLSTHILSTYANISYHDEA